LASYIAPPPEDLGGALARAEASPGSVGRRPTAFPPGLSPPVGSPSHGSTLHLSGHCRPCAWFWKPSGCLNGLDCTRCHLCPAGEIKARKKAKQTVMQLGLATPHFFNSSAAAPQPLGFSLDPEDLVSLSPAPEMPSTIPPLPGSSAAAAQNRGRSFSSDQDSTTGAGSSSEPEATTSSSEHGEIPAVSKASAKAKNCQEGPPAGKGDLHSAGRCRPCAWFWKPIGCQSEQDCKYCHLCPEGEIKNRKKSKAMMLRMGLDATPTSDLAPEQQQQQAKWALSLAPLL